MIKPTQMTRVHWQNTNMLTSKSGYTDTTLTAAGFLADRSSHWHLNPPWQDNTRTGESVCTVCVCVCVCVFVCVCVRGDQHVKDAHAACLRAGGDLWRGLLGKIWGRLMDRPSAYWWAGLMLMAVMSHDACQQHGEDREPFNLLIPAGINSTAMLLETNMADIAWLKCNGLIFRTISSKRYWL